MGEEGEINWVSTSLSMKQELESRSGIRRRTDVCFLKWVLSLRVQEENFKTVIKLF